MAKMTASAKNPAKIAITLQDREYHVACDAGEEQRLQEIVRLVDNTLTETTAKNPNTSESRLFMLACLLLADELIETRRVMNRTMRAEEDLMVAAVEHLRQRVANIAQQVGRA
jgi:cell division protein ZapA